MAELVFGRISNAVIERSNAMPDDTLPVPNLKDSLAALDKAFVESMIILNNTIEAEFEQGSRQAVAQLEAFNEKVKEIIESREGLVLDDPEFPETLNLGTEDANPTIGTA